MKKKSDEQCKFSSISEKKTGTSRSLITGPGYNHILTVRQKLIYSSWSQSHLDSMSASRFETPEIGTMYKEGIS